MRVTFPVLLSRARLRRCCPAASLVWSAGPLLAVAFLAAVASCPADTNLFDAGTSWNLPGDWGLGHVPTGSDALEFNGPASTTLDNSFGAQTLSFDTGSATVSIDANAPGTGGTAACTLTLSSRPTPSARRTFLPPAARPPARSP